MMRTTCLAAFGLALFAGTTTAQTIQINEIYASHTGTDDMEFLELKGTPSMKLDGYMVLVVEGDSTGAGTLDRAWDLKGQVIPNDGYFVLGDDAVPAVDLKIGASNTIENGTDTFYLVKAGDPSKVSALVGKSVVDPNNSSKTTLSSVATIVDLVGMADGGITSSDTIFDGALQLGPDGTFLPAGVYRAADLKWCNEAWLDFDDTVNKNAPSTAGAKNTALCMGGKIAAKGNSCLTGPGTTGGPTLSSTRPQIGLSFDTTVAGASTGATGLLYGGVEGGPTAFLGCSIYLNIAALINIGPIDLTTGTGTLKLALPYNVSLLGAKFAVQAAVGAGSSLWLTNAATGQIGY